MLNSISRGLIKGKSGFLTLSPSPFKLFNIRWASFIPTALKALGVVNVITKKISSQDFAIDFASSYASRILTDKLFMGKVKSIVQRAYLISKERPNWKLSLIGLGASRRTWVSSLDKSLLDERIIKNLIIIYHDAHKAGKHIDLHMGHVSTVYRVSGKPVEKKIRFNNKGLLTEESKQALLKHLRKEIKSNSRTVWNHDHTISNAMCSWPYDPDNKDTEYGAGVTRQIILKDKVEFYHPETTSSLHLYAPAINPNQGMYIYQIYPQIESRAPILIAGNLIPMDPNFQDRLHLKMANNLKTFIEKVDYGTITRKYDGASAYLESTSKAGENHGVKIFSPRMSKKTGHRIEYTYKVPEISNQVVNAKAQAMGELMFRKPTIVGKVTKILGIRGPEYICWNYLPAASIGGILNNNEVRSRRVEPEIRLYRIDKWNGNKTTNIPFFDNRKLQFDYSRIIGSPFVSVVKIVKPHKDTRTEGLVGVPEGLSINDGIKVKWWADANDWKVISQKLSISPKGNVQGVVWFKSLESGKEFKLGPGSLGNVDHQLDFLEKNLIGKVYKVHGRNGHEGRAAKIVEEHMDK
jgi:hypothetical protein